MDRLVKYLVIPALFFCCCIHNTAQREQSQQKGRWGDWSAWTLCSTTCGYGVRTRTRTYAYGSGDKYDSDDTYTGTSLMQCYPKPCPLNGSWTMWAMWGECSRGCGGGVRKRERTCTEPSPAYDGANCTGKPFKEGECNKSPCPLLPSNFNMSTCSKGSMFMCNSERMCVPKSERCDGEAHCHDGTDEVGCRRSSIGHVRFSNASTYHSSSCIVALMAALITSWLVKLFIGGQRLSVDQSAPRP